MALSLPATANAADIRAALQRAPQGSSASYLLRALDREGRDPKPSSGENWTVRAADEESLAEAMTDALARGGSLIDTEFAETLATDARRRRLTDVEGNPANPCTDDVFGEPFNLAWLMQVAPFDTPFTRRLVRDLNDSWYPSAEPVNSRNAGLRRRPRAPHVVGYIGQLSALNLAVIGRTQMPELNICFRIYDVQLAIEHVRCCEFTNIVQLVVDDTELRYLHVVTTEGRGMQAWELRQRLAELADHSLPTNVIDSSYLGMDGFSVCTEESMPTEFRVEGGNSQHGGVGIVAYVKATSPAHAREVLAEHMRGMQYCATLSSDVEIYVYFDAHSDQLKVRTCE